MNAASLAQHWLAATRRRGWLARLLLPVTAVYALLWWLRSAFWALGWRRPERLPVPVIVVGNVVVGGAGKTPTTLAILRHLQAIGHRPGVVSRGYGRSASATVAVEPDTPAERCGDEPLLIRQRAGVPVVVDADRVAAARHLLARHPEVDVLVCDDGLQHWRLHRDIAVAVFDARGTGNGWLLPSGLLREPWPVRHRFAPHLVLRQRDEGAPLPSSLDAGALPVFDAQRRLAPVCRNLLGQERSLAAWAGAACAVISGIAQPDRFWAMLKAAGATPAPTVALPDHASAAAWTAALAGVRGDVFCTEKDAVKLRGLLAPADAARVWVVALELEPEAGFLQAISARLATLARV